MKLKNWLLLSYLIVMILPLIAGYLLFAWIQSYNNEQKVNEYLETSAELQEIKSILNNPELYSPKTDKTKVEQLASKKLSIVLYNPDGLVIFTSNPAYTLKQGYQTYSYKQPVFVNRDLTGFFYVQLARDKWVGGVSDRSIIVIAIFAGMFLLLYGTIIFLVNRKLTKRLINLMDEMTAFARGHTIAETKTKNDEIGALRRHFYAMRSQINSANAIIAKEQRKKEQMIASISHDLKTPLTSIKAYTESLDSEQYLTEAEKKEYMKVIQDKTDFIKQMLDDLLTFTLLQSPTYEMEFVEVDGEEFFDMLISDYEVLCKEKGIHLYTESHVAGTYRVNPKQMMRVADNLMMNAIRHTSQGEKIWLQALSDLDASPEWLFDIAKKSHDFDFARKAYIIVQNAGKGIDGEKLKYVFDPLYQGDQARSKKEYHGTGLGLSITKQIIEKHGGSISIFSAEDTGTCVICCLPRELGGDIIEKN